MFNHQRAKHLPHNAFHPGYSPCTHIRRLPDAGSIPIKNKLMKSVQSGYRALTALLLAAATCFAPADGFGKSDKGNNGKKPQPEPAPVVVPTTYSGRAVAISVDNVKAPVQGPIYVVDTGWLPSTGGSLFASIEDYKLMADDGVTVALGVELATAATVGADRGTTSDTTLNGFRVLLRNMTNQFILIEADYIGASARAYLHDNGQGAVQSSVTIQNLRINGVQVNVTGETNQIVTFNGGHLVLNQVVSEVGDGHADIEVSAIYFFVCECLNGSIGEVVAGCSGGPAPQPGHGDCGKLTGGGWITGTPSGAKATFGVSGGIRRGEFWGHLNYIDHGSGMKVKSTAVTGFEVSPTNSNSRIIRYNVTINGVPGTAIVEAWDKGEPGRDDFFSIRLSTGYFASGTLGGDRPGGGNLQLHKCPPGWAK
jgi:hypothetical protein